jgi:outer membrane receptor protein involved in Fe transport
MKYVGIIFLFLMSYSAFAQKLTIQGSVIDSTAKPLDYATVMLLNAKDSSLATFDRTNEQGFFALKNVNPANYLLKITFVGYAPFTKPIDNQAVGLLDLGKIQLQGMSKELATIVVEGEKSPVTIKKDTIEFNAGSFKTKPNAAVEDLLKKLPGVQVERDGTVRAQGEVVRRVTVDGKDFFGRDPKMATQNLPADAVEKVQVFDRKSDQTAFSGIDDGQREKTINLELKEKNKKGFFGNLMAGAGTNQRFESKANLSRFSKTTQLSFIGMGNNVNQQGFSLDEYLNFSGELQRAMAGGGRGVRLQIDGNSQSGIPLNFGGRNYGIMQTWAGGLNFNHQFNKKTEINGSYFYNSLRHQINREVLRQNFLPTGDFTLRQNSRQNNRNQNHRLNWTLEHKIDSMNSIRWNTNVSYNDNTTQNESDNRTLNNEQVAENEGFRNTLSDGTALNLNSTFLYRHRFAKKGRTISSTLNFGLNGLASEGTLQAQNRFLGNNPFTQNFNQTNTQANDLWSYGANVSFTEPIAKRKYVEFNYSFQKNINQVNREVFDLVNENAEFNPLLSNQFNSNYTYHRVGSNFRVNKKKYNFATGLSFQNTNLTGDLILLNVNIDRNFANILPNFRFNYDFSNSKRLDFNYETSVQIPSIQQLQPVIDNSDPLNIYIGNPNLRPEYVHRANFNFSSFDPINFVSFFGTINSTYSTNRITMAQNIDERFVRTSTPVNLRDNLFITSNLSFGFPIKKLSSRINLSNNNSLMRGINLLNERENRFKQQTIGGNVRYEYNYKEAFSIAFSADLSQQKTVYEGNNAQNQEFLNQTYTAETNLTLPWGVQVAGMFDYLIYRSQTTNFAQEIPFLNLSISKFMLKAKAGELKFSVVNLLDRNIGINQNAQINFIEQETITSLNRYFMVSFTYALNRALNPMGGRGGMMRVIRR